MSNSRIPGYLFGRRWETRSAAALALERVGAAVDPQALVHCLFGLACLGSDVDADAAAAVPLAAHEGLLLSLARLDLATVLRDGEPLLASTGEVGRVALRRRALRNGMFQTSAYSFDLI